MLCMYSRSKLFPTRCHGSLTSHPKYVYTFFLFCRFHTVTWDGRPSPPPSWPALPYILGIFFLLPPPAPFLSLYTEKVIVALAFPRLPLLHTRPEDDFLDEDEVALFAVSLPSSSISISRSRKTLVSPILRGGLVWKGLGWGRKKRE